MSKKTNNQYAWVFIVIIAATIILFPFGTKKEAVVCSSIEPELSKDFSIDELYVLTGADECGHDTTFINNMYCKEIVTETLEPGGNEYTYWNEFETFDRRYQGGCTHMVNTYPDEYVFFGTYKGVTIYRDIKDFVTQYSMCSANDNYTVYSGYQLKNYITEDKEDVEDKLLNSDTNLLLLKSYIDTYYTCEDTCPQITYDQCSTYKGMTDIENLWKLQTCTLQEYILCTQFYNEAMNTPKQVMHMSLDTSALTDSTGNNVPGTAYNDAVPTSGGVVSSAYQFFGGNAYISVPYNQVMDMAGKVTLSAWIKFDTLTHSYIVAKVDSYMIQLRDYGGQWLLEGSIWRKDAENVVWHVPLARTINSPEPGKWYHVVFTYDNTLPSSQAKIYVNSNLERAGTSTFDIHTSSNVMTIGNRADTALRGVYGTIDDVRVYNYALSPTEINTLFELGDLVWYSDHMSNKDSYLSGLSMTTFIINSNSWVVS